MNKFYVGQKVRYTKEGKDIPKGFETTVLTTGCFGGKPTITILYDGIQILSYQSNWEPVNDKFSEDLFQ